MRIVLLLDINNSVIESLLEVLFSSHELISLKNLSFYEHSTEEDELYLITNNNETLELYKEDNELKKIFFIGECEPSKLIQPLPAKSCTNLLLNYFKDIESVENNNQPTYYSIPICLLLEAHKVEFDLYLKITKKDEGPEYIKRFESSDSLDMIALHRYLEKGEEHLYFKLSDKEKVEEFIKALFINSYLNEKSIETLSKSTKAVKYLFAEFGMSEDSFEYVNTLSESILENINSQESSSLVKEALLNKSDTFFKKALITSTIATSVLKASSWAKKSDFEQIAKLSLICDIYLDESLCLINNEEKLVKASISDQEKELVLTHAKKSYELIRDDQEFSNEFKNMILNHHGRESGIGFSETLSQDSSQLLMVFRVSEDFAISLIEESDKGNFNVIKIYEYIKERHSHLGSQEIIKQAFFSIYAIMKAG